MKPGKTFTSWRSKLEKEMQPKLVEVKGKWAERIGHGKMLVPTPTLVDKIIKKIPAGKLATVNLLREKMAGDFKADMTCPLTTGIFLNIAANAAEEDRSKGKKKITPWWRVLKEEGCLNPKFPGGVELQAKRLRAEGFSLIKSTSRSPVTVKEYQNNLVMFDN